MSVGTVEDSYQLSPMQQGMLFHNLRYGQQSGVDVEQIVCTFHESLNISAFERAWQQAVERHAALRTSFRWQGLDEPLQDVHQQVAVPLQAEDWREMSAREREGRLAAYLDADRRRGFDLAGAPPMRLAVFRMAEDDYRAVWTFHHAFLDGRSFAPVLKEVMAFYEAFSEGRELSLDPPPPFRRFIDWLQQQNLSGAKAFWQQALAGFTAPTSLLLTPAPDGKSDREQTRGEQHIRLTTETTAELKRLSRQHQLTLNTMVQGAWALLLSSYSGEEDVVFGATRACRQATVEGAESMVGVCINTLPVRARVSASMPLLAWLGELRAQHLAVREYEHTPLVKIQDWSGVPGGTPLFETILVFENRLLNSTLREQGESWEKREFRLLERTNYPLTVYGYGEPELLLKIAYDRPRFDDAAIARMLGHLRMLLESMIAEPTSKRLVDLPLLTKSERHQLLVQWNATFEELREDMCVHELLDSSVAETPDAVAVVFENEQLTYRELNARANQLAHHLRGLGVGPEVLVGLIMERSLEMMVGLLGVLKAGGAYVPLDPSYPRERLAFMLEDAQVKVLLTQERLVEYLPEHAARVVCLDSGWETIARESAEDVASGVTPDNLAYVIYTSGSTGRPKGVMVEHRNVANFFAGMDRAINDGGDGAPGTWLAVTSISFDISVLELFWTLARGFKVVLHAKDDKALASTAGATPRPAEKGMDFSLFYFASDDGEANGDKYRLLIEGAKFADRSGFSAVWTPERHFHPFGGLYPNPSVVSAFIAAITERIRIRAGSVVLPLHSPIRVAEEWSAVDNLSKGRVDISFASGWHDRDFIFAPENYAERKEIMRREIETVRRLWRGETVTGRGGAGNPVEVKIYPQPIQRELPFWVTAAGGPETFRAAGEMGAHLLTHLLFQSTEEIAQKIAVYRDAWRAAGHRGEGHVTIMLHTFIGEDLDDVREKVRKPFTEYLRSSVDLIKKLASGPGREFGSVDLTEADEEVILSHAFERYFVTSGLFGTPQTCLRMVDRLKAIGVDEVACLIDFGVETDSVISSFPRLNELREQSNRREAKSGPDMIPELIAKHGVTHMQCTPSMARMLALDPESFASLRPLRRLMLGGEALPVSLAGQLSEVVSGEIHNMYGPTETTVWSTTHRLGTFGNTVPIGRPVANTQIYIVDRHLRPVPVGVAGELLIGGDGVVRGYWRRPELTAGKFIPNPFSNGKEARLYRTGDLARYLPDGEIEFLGRLDHQVKIRGFRIELGEIEAVLGQHPQVRAAVVLAREDVPGDKRLVAYVIPDPQQRLDTSELRDYMRGKLPEQMVPASFLMLEAMPQTPNGKINRAALPAPDRSRREAATAYRAPHNEMELTIAEVWQKELDLERVGTHDNFFDLGGNSLLMVQVNGALREALSREIPLVDLFEHPTVSSLARHLSLASRDQSSLLQSDGRAQTRKEAMMRRQQLRQQSNLASRVGA